MENFRGGCVMNNNIGAFIAAANSIAEFKNNSTKNNSEFPPTATEKDNRGALVNCDMGDVEINRDDDNVQMNENTIDESEMPLSANDANSEISFSKLNIAGAKITICTNNSNNIIIDNPIFAGNVEQNNQIFANDCQIENNARMFVGNPAPEMEKSLEAALREREIRITQKKNRK